MAFLFQKTNEMERPQYAALKVRKELNAFRYQRCWIVDSVTRRETPRVYKPHGQYLAYRLFVFSLMLITAVASQSSFAANSGANFMIVRLTSNDSKPGPAKASYELLVPKNYFRDKDNLLRAQSITGVNGIFLWFLYGTNEGISSNTHSQYSNTQSPNDGVHLYIQAHRPDASGDLGKRYLDQDLNAPAYRPAKLTLNPEKKLGQGITVYKYANDNKIQNQFVATFVQSDGALVFVRCQVGGVCKVHKTWKAKLDVQYFFFHDRFEKDLVRLDESVNQLLDSFRPHKL